MIPREPRLVWHGLGTVLAAIVPLILFAGLFEGAVAFFGPMTGGCALVGGVTVYLRRINDPVWVLQLAIVLGLLSVFVLSALLVVRGVAGAAVLVLFFGSLLGVAGAAFGAFVFLVTAFYVLR